MVDKKTINYYGDAPRNNIVYILLIVIVVLITGFYFYTKWNNSVYDNKILKASNYQKEQATLRLNQLAIDSKKINDSLLSINIEIKKLLELERLKPTVIPKKIIRYEKPLVINNVADSSIIKSFAKSTERYTQIQQ